MKSSGGAGGGSAVSSYGFQAKRRWRWLVLAVLGLVVLSMLVPLVFVLGLYNGFHSTGYVSDRHNTPSHGLEGFDRRSTGDTINRTEGDQSTHVEKIMKKFEPTIPKDVLKSQTQQSKNKTINKGSTHDGQQKGVSLPPPRASESIPDSNNSRVTHKLEATQNRKGSIDDSGKLCELTFGSYCLWREEHKEDMKDCMVKKLKDQLFVARAYYPSIAKLPSQDKLTQQMKQHIQEMEKILSESSTDTDLPPGIEKKSQKMDTVIARAKSFHVECSNVDKKLRQILDLTEDEANFHMKQSAFLYKLTVQTMPKSLHCLSLRLTVEYFKSLHNMEATSEKYTDPTLHHYVIFSNEVLAASVVINSTVLHSKESGNLVFHVLTDKQNYFAMKMWFFRNTYKEATVQVLNIEHLNLYDKETARHLYLPEEFRVTSQSVDNPTMGQTKTVYISIFSHSHYLLPDIFPNLKKVLVLDDDVVVQKDLSALWSLNMGGKVNGAVQSCSTRLGQLKNYLGGNSFKGYSCAWMSGLNVIDLHRWRELQVTETYQRLSKKLSMKDGSAENFAWRASLLTFEDLLYPLDDSWVLSGLGHDYGIDVQSIKKAALLHYNGNMKPWLELGIPKYRSYWKKFLKQEDRFMSDCNVSS